MPNQPGKLPAPDTLINIPRLVTAFYNSIPTRKSPPSASPSAPPAIAAPPSTPASTTTTSSPSPRPSSSTAPPQNTTGPLFLAQDTHALSEPAFATALEVLAANGVDRHDRPGPRLHAHARALARHPHLQRRGTQDDRADGIVITPSHNPPEDGGFKYNPPNGGPADTTATKWIENRANELIAAKLSGVKRIPYAKALAADTTHRHDYITAYVDDLANVIDFDALAGLHPQARRRPARRRRRPLLAPHRRAVQPPARSPQPLRRPHLPLHDPRLGRQIRMDCSSPFAMACMIANKDIYDVAWACDTDHDRHGIVTRIRRPAQPQPLPRRLHPVPLHPSPGLVATTSASARPSSPPASSTASPKASTAPCSKSP